jgi:hypothetical protein
VADPIHFASDKPRELADFALQGPDAKAIGADPAEVGPVAKN